MPILSSTLQIQHNTYQNTNGNFHRTKIILKFVWKHEIPQTVKQSWERTKLEEPPALILNYTKKLQ